MTATYTADLFSTLDGFGSPQPDAWGGYWDKQTPEFLDHRLSTFGDEQRMVLGGNTYRMFMMFVEMIGSNPEADKAGDPWVTAMLQTPTTVVSSTLQEPLVSPNVTLAAGDAVDIVARLRDESDVPLRSHGSMSMNRALLAAGLVDRLQLTVFPVITGQTGTHPIFRDGPDFDLELIESRTFDGGILELTYRPLLHV